MNNNEKKMIWIISHYAGGPSYCPRIPDYLLAKYLQEHGYKTVIIASSYVHNTNINFINNKKIAKKQIVDGVPFIMIRTKNYSHTIDRIQNMFEFYFRLMRIYKKIERPDLIIAAMPTPTSCLAGVQIAKHFHVPYITSIVDLWPLSIVEYSSKFNNANLIIQGLYIFEKWIYKKSDELVFTWEGAYDYIIDKHWNKQIPKSKFHYINIGVELDKFNENLKKWKLDDYDLEKDIFTVMYCGSIREANDIATTVSCAKILLEEGYENQIRFIIYGDGPDKNKLIKRCHDEGISNISFKGNIDKKYIPYVLTKSNINILNLKPSATQKYGNSSNKLFEYLAAGNPVIANIDEGKYPIISKYNCGKIVKPNSPEEYAECIKYFYKLDKETFIQYQENAKNTAKLFDTKVLNFSWERLIQRCIMKNTT